MKKKHPNGKGAEECRSLDWVELSKKLDSGETVDAGDKEPGSDAIVSETISQIVSEDYLKVDTSDMDGVRAAVDSFYAYDKKAVKKKAAKLPDADEDPQQAIKRSVDEKIIIRSEELKKKRREAVKKNTTTPAKKKTQNAAAKPAGKKGSKKSVPADDAFRHSKGLEKYRKMGILPTKKDGPSEYRKKAANWRYDDVPEAAVSDEAIEQAEGDITLFEKIKDLSVVQWCCVAMSAILLITSVMTTTVYADYLGQQNKERAMAELPYFTDDASMIAYSGESFLTEDVELEDAATEMPEQTGKMLSLVLTSVEKDLKVKLVDDEDTLVKGVKWGITVTDKDDNESSYEDEDEDGIIHLTGINAGDYSVAINDSDSLSGYVFPTVGQTVSVKAKIEYKVIANIKDEIKKESEVNAAAEDNGNKAADVETGTAPKDTVEFVESSREENGEVFEEATVDLSKTRLLASAGGRLIGALKDLADSTRLVSKGVMGLIDLKSAPRTVAENDNDWSADLFEKYGNMSQEELQELKTQWEQEQERLEKEKEEQDKKEKEEKEESGKLIDLTEKKDETSGEENKEKDKTKEEPINLNETDPSKYDPDSPLYDSENNELYVYEDDTYRLAKYSDYANFSKFYKKVIGYIYSGWQNIDGKTYYYTKDHEKVTGEQVIGGVAYTFREDGSLDNGTATLGIDVSKYQPSINWDSVKASGIDFVIIRCGYRGASTGVLIEDPYFKSHIKGAKSVGLKVGVYFFSTALSEAEAVEEASMCAALCSGYGLNYPVFLDVESSSRPGYNTLSASERTANIQAFCKTISSAGYTPGLYANKTWLSEKINTGSLSCKIWLAQYRAEGPTYSGRYDIWQYTSKGSVNGISGNVDMNRSYM